MWSLVSDAKQFCASLSTLLHHRFHLGWTWRSLLSLASLLILLYNLSEQLFLFLCPFLTPAPYTQVPLHSGGEVLIFKAFGPLSLHCGASTSEYFLVNTDYYSEKLLTYFYAYKNVCLLILTQQMTTPCQGWECEQEVGRVS